MQYCYNEAIGKEGYVFIRPGLETKGISTPRSECSTHPSHDLNELFDWNQLQQIDARMRFCSDIHLFAKYDDNAIEIASASTLKSMPTEDHLWTAKETYTESSSRSLEPTLRVKAGSYSHGEKNIDMSGGKILIMARRNRVTIPAPQPFHAYTITG